MDSLREEKILEQLNKIIESSLFKKSNKLCQFLSFIVKESLKKEGIDLKQYNIAVFAFGRSEDFDPTDPIVRIQASRLRNLLSLYYHKEGVRDKIIISLPKGRYKPQFSLRKEAISTKKPNVKKNTLAICLFKVLSSNSKNQYISDGFTEELLMELSRYKHIQLIRATNIDSNINPSIARFSLIGCINLTDEVVKISVSVIDNTNQHQIWSNQQKHDTNQINWIEIQEGLAIKIGQKIADLTGVLFKNNLNSANWKKLDNNEYDTMLLFHRYNNNLNEVNIELLISRLENSIKSNPETGLMWAILTNIYTHYYVFGADRTYLDKALNYGHRAIKLQPDSQHCHTYYGYALLINNERELSNYHFNIALELNPNSPYFMAVIGWVFCLNGEWEKGLLLIEKGIKINLNYPKWLHLAPVLYFIKEKDYINAYKEAFKFDMPKIFWDPLVKLVVCYKLNKMKEAQGYLSNLLKLNPNFIELKEELISHLVKSISLKNSILNSVKEVSRLKTTDNTLKKGVSV